MLEITKTLVGDFTIEDRSSARFNRVLLGFRNGETLNITQSKHSYGYGRVLGLYEILASCDEDPYGWLTEEDVLTHIERVSKYIPELKALPNPENK